MIPARLIHEIEILSFTEAGDSQFGGVEESEPSVLETVMAQVLMVGGKERFSSDKFELAEKAARFKIWWRNDVTTLHKIRWNGDVYDITGIKELGYRDGLEICGEVRNADRG